MPTITHRDSGGEPRYSEPQGEEGWDLEADPSEMVMKALCAAVARDILGCSIEWSDYYCDWCCMCRGIPHACDSQCSAIATTDMLYDRVMKKCEGRGIALLAGTHDRVLRAALTIWRELNAAGMS